MGILQNGNRDTIGVFRTYGGTVANNCAMQGTRGNYNLTGMKRNITAGEGITDGKVGLPMGYVMKGWQLPQKAGMISARMHDMAVTATGAGVMGYPIVATGDMTFTVADVDGQLISSGSGAAEFAITVADLLLTASIGGTGSASFEITAANALLGAEASIEGSASFAITVGNAQSYPINDASPLREGTASMAITGTLIPYAIGSMSGSTVDTGVLTVDAIAAGVLAAALTAPIAADIRKVNAVTVTGDGQPGSEWGSQ